MKRHAVAAMVGLVGLLAAAACSPSPTVTNPIASSTPAGQTPSADVTSTAGTGGVSFTAGSTTTAGVGAAGTKQPTSGSTAKGATVIPGTTSTPGGAAGTSNNGNASVSIGPVIELSPETSVSGSTSSGTAPGTAPNGSTSSPAPTCSTSGPTMAAGPVNPLGITNVQFSTTLASDGSAANPRTVFSAAQDPKIIAVATLNNLPAGTQINYVHIHGTCFTPSSTFTLKQTLKHFYIQFAAQSPNTLPVGHYRVRYYVNQQPAYDASYDIQ